MVFYGSWGLGGVIKKAKSLKSEGCGAHFWELDTRRGDAEEGVWGFWGVGINSF